MYYTLNLQELKNLVFSLDQSLNESVYVKYLRDQITVLGKVAVGEKYVDFSLPTPDGNKLSLSDVAQGKYLPSFKEFFQIGITFSLTVLAWIFFRAENIGHAWAYLSTIFSKSLFTIPYHSGMKMPILLIIIFIFVEWLGRDSNYAIENLRNKFNPIVRWTLYLFIIFLIGMYKGENQQFIYFQF